MASAARHTHAASPRRQAPRRRNRRVARRTGPPWPVRVVVGTVRGTVRLIPWLLGLGLCGVLGWGGYVGWEKLVRDPRLAVRRVEAVGVAGKRAQEVLTYGATPLGAPLLTLDLDAIAARVRRHPWIRTAVVRRRLPDRVIVEVNEHIPALLVNLGELGELYIADEDGQLFKRLAPSDNLHLPVVTGLNRQEASAHMDRTIERVRESIGLAAAVENHPADLGALESLHWDNDLGWSVVVQGSGIGVPGVRIHLGRQPLARLSHAIAAIRVCAERHQSPAVIWVDGAKNPDRVQVQLHGVTPAAVKTGAGNDGARGGAYGTEG